MIFTTTARAAVKSVLFLAGTAGAGIKYSIAEVADNIDENTHTVGKLLQSLVRNNIIKSSKGPNGGYYLTEGQYDIPLIKVIEAIDGKYIFNQCLLGLNKCNSIHPCRLHSEFKASRKLFEQTLLNKSISDLMIHQ